MTVAPRRQAMLFADGRVLGCAAAWVAGSGIAAAFRTAGPPRRYRAYFASWHCAMIGRWGLLKDRISLSAGLLAQVREESFPAGLCSAGWRQRAG